MVYVRQLDSKPEMDPELIAVVLLNAHEWCTNELGLLGTSCVDERLMAHLTLTPCSY